jgi:hypothetical protein
MIERLFLRHPRTVGESYLEHQAVALSFAGELFGAGAACAVHAAVPALFTKTASRAVERLHSRLVLHRNGARHLPRVNRGRVTGELVAPDGYDI